MIRLLLLLALLLPVAGQPVRVIFDTDIGNDVDDALALAMLHGLEARGESRLLAVTITKGNPWTVPYIEAVNHFYGRGWVPIGLVKGGKTPEDSPMIHLPCQRRGLAPRVDTPEAVELLRRTLAAQPDGAVTVVQVGFFTNLARLLESDRALVERKVKLLVVMAGAYPNGEPEFNVVTDVPSAKKVFAEWPTPIVASGFEVGNAMPFPARSIEQDFGWATRSPVVEAYREFQKMPYDRPTWDLTAVLYAVRSERGYFALSAPGRISVDDAGRTTFAPEAAGRHRHLVLENASRALEAMVQLASQPR